MAEWALAHPWLALAGWCWAWWCFGWGWTPLVSVRPYTRAELDKGGRE